MTRPSLRHPFRPFLLALVLVVGFAAAGCYRGRGSANDEEPIYVDVTNHNMSDMNIYAVHSSMRVRLGTVTTNRTEHFRVQPHEFGDGTFQLFASPIGGARGYLSEMVYPSSGQTVEWTLEAVLVQSSLTIRDSDS